jgi:hypothetical protein
VSARHPRLRRALAASLGAWLAIVAADHVRAYVIGGPKWTTSQVPYYINPSNADVTPDAVIAALDQAATGWTAQSGASIRLQLAGTTSGSTIQNNGKNEVFFSNESNGSVAASCYYTYSGSTILDADIKFYDGGFRFYTGTSGCASGLYLEDVATHEFGHFIGIGHSPVITATMYASINGCTQAPRTLDADDIAAALALYPAGALQAPAAPYGLSAIAAGTASINLTWADASTNEGGFRIERATGGGSFSLVASLGANTTSYVNTGLTAATAYSYRVQAYNTAGSSGYSNTATATTSPVTTPPAMPSGPNPADGATNVQPSSIAWAVASGASSYDVYFGTTPAPGLYTNGATTPAVGVSRLTAGATYYWRVVARNTIGTTSGPTWRFTVKAKGKPR